MSQAERPQSDAPTSPELDLPDVASYRDGDATVICDRHDPAAWIRSSVTVDVKR